MRRATFSIALVVLGLLALAGPAAAGKPTSSLSLVVLGSGDASVAAAAPTHGGEITFDVNTTETARPFVNVRCYQGGAFVYDAWHGFFASYAATPNFTLASSYWTAGAADCTARLVAFSSNGRERTLATTSFRVEA